METIKSYTDIGQSRKLGEILPRNTADNTWKRIAIAGSNLNVPEELQYIHDGNMPFCFYSGVGVPCWSLAALLDYIKDKCGYFELVYLNVYRLSTNVHDVYDDDPIDACVAMIEKLHK